MTRTRLLLVDDNDDFLEGVSAWLESEDGIDIVGTASSGSEAIEQVGRLRPDIVLMDVTMPEIDGFHATLRIKSAADAPRVILMTFLDSETARHEAWAAGADGFLAKSDVTRLVPGLVRDLMNGDRDAVDDNTRGVSNKKQPGAGEHLPRR